MVKFGRLYLGEIQRLFKYRIVFFGFLVSAIWIAVVGLTDKTTATALLPTLIGMDAGMMSILLLAAQFYYEKQEGTIHTLLVTPVPVAHILMAKIAASMTTGIISMLMVAGLAWIIHGITFSLLLMGLYVLVIVAGNTAIGYLFILISKDFMSMLVRIMGVLLLFYVPNLLVPLGILTEKWDFLSLMSPSYASSYLIESLFVDKPLWKILASAVYLAGIAAALYPLFIAKRFARISVEG